MTVDQATSQLLSAHAYFEEQNQGYKSWGNVEVVQIALKISDTSYLVTNERKSLGKLTSQDVQLMPFTTSMSSTTSFFQQIFSTRKKINTILITRQQFASQVREEIPAILDDQAQLLGISVQIAKSTDDAPKAIKGRFACILSGGSSICIGSSIDDAYVAAQLLEKTAKVFLEAKYLGGARSINKIEAWFMQQYYQFKYSKEAVKNK